MPKEQTTEEQLRQQPGIDVTRLSPGTLIRTETAVEVYQFKVVYGLYGVVEVTSTDRRLHKPVLARFSHSLYGLANGISLEHWIGQSLRMVLAFKNANLTTLPVISARVEGKGWYYEVF